MRKMLDYQPLIEFTIGLDFYSDAWWDYEMINLPLEKAIRELFMVIEVSSAVDREEKTMIVTVVIKRNSNLGALETQICKILSSQGVSLK